MTKQELVTIESDPQSLMAYRLSPEETVATAMRIANCLIDIVEQKKLYTIISGKKHLAAEAWQTVVSLDLADPLVDWVEPIYADGEMVGYQAKVSIFKDGRAIASGIMPCGFDDFSCRGKTGVARDRACMSTAQTWAGAKAARTKYAWIVVLAGYSPTPADEMSAGVQEDQQAKKAPTKRQQPPRATQAGKPTEDVPGTSPTPPKSRSVLFQELSQALADNNIERGDMMHWVKANLQAEDLNGLNDIQIEKVIEAVLAGLPF